MTMKPEIADWGLIPYEEAWNRQREWFNRPVRASSCLYLGTERQGIQYAAGRGTIEAGGGHTLPH